MSWISIEIAGWRFAIERPENPRHSGLGLAFLGSLILHGLFLFVVHAQPKDEPRGKPRLRVSLHSAASKQKTPSPTPAPAAEKRPTKTAPTAQHIMTAPGSRHRVAAPPKWTKAEKNEMDSFLNELDQNARSRPAPTLADRARQMAREVAVNEERGESALSELVERRPNAPPPDPFSMDLYFDGVIRQLNRQAAFVKKEGKQQGQRKAMVAFRLNPDGSLKSFNILDPGDQGDEIAHIRAIIERAVPFAAFPPDLGRSARSVGLVVCINPRAATTGNGGFQRLGGTHC